MVTHVEVRHYTVGKIQDFPVTHILREINFGECQMSNAILQFQEF